VYLWDWANGTNNRNMQNCFRQHPDVYAAELRDDDEPVGDATNGDGDGDGAAAAAAAATTPKKETSTDQLPTSTDDEQKTPRPVASNSTGRVEDFDRRKDSRDLGQAGDESEEGRRVDATDANKAVFSEKKGKKE